MSTTRQSRLTGVRRRRLVPQIAAAVALVAGSALVLTAGQTATAQISPNAVQLGTAASYAVLGSQTVTNTGTSTISGDVGVSPLTAITGFPPGIITNGVQHVADAHAAQAKADSNTAYLDAAGRAVTETVGVELGDRTLVAGVYAGGELGITGTLRLDGQNDPNAVFVFKAASALNTAPASRVELINGANPCNVFWQVTSSAVLGTTSVFVGTIVALASVTLGTGATVEGRAVALNGAVTLDTNVFTQPNCAIAAPTTTTAGAGTTVPATTAPGGTGDTIPATTTPAPVTTFTPTDITLPATGTGSLVTQSGVGFAVLLIGLAALLVARRRQPA